jgi:energy-coupling factor transport system ATP-binding protein
MRSAVGFAGVTFRYPGTTELALRDVDLQVPEGSLVLVTGPTGSGKSTLLRCINGLVPHFSGGDFGGRVVVRGRDTIEFAPRDLADVVAFVPQDPGASFVLDRVEDELAYAMENLGTPSQTMRRRIEDVLDLLDIEDLRNRSVRSLSGGERQRVAIAAALTPQPDVLVLDEPTSQLDPQGAEDVLAALQRLVHDLGMTVLVAEHRLERVAGFADLTIACRDGRVEIGAPEKIFREFESGPPVARLGRMFGWSPLPLTVRDSRRHAARVELPPVPARPHHPRGAVEIKTGDLRAGYGGRDVLVDVNFELCRGEVVALLGRNGAGKTTLLRALAGLHQPSSGHVAARRGRVRTGTDVALCPQEPEVVLFRDSVRAEIETTLKGARTGATSEAALDALGLLPFESSHPRDLSAGRRLLVAIAAIAATGAPVLLLDEPTRGLDPDTKEQLRLFLQSHASSGAVMFATHDVEFAAAVASRAIMLAGGEIIADGDPSTVMGDSVVFAPQTARVFGREWLSPVEVANALGISSGTTNGDGAQ